MASCLALSACATGMSSTQASSKAVMTQVAEGDSGLVFYRDVNDGAAPVNIYINGEYLSSLQSGHYAEVVTCAMPQRIGAFVVNTDRAYFAKHNHGVYFDPPKNQISYLRVHVAENGQVALSAIEPQTAQQEVGNKLQSNTLSRVSKENTCQVQSMPAKQG